MAVPDYLTDLALLFDNWSIDDLSLRVLKIANATDVELRSLVERVLPRAEEIDTYLNGFGDKPLDEPARRLILLAESALDAQTEIGLREDPIPLDE